METMMRELGLAWRMLIGRPAFAALAVGTLGLGIGAHAALFSVVDGVLLEPVDLPASEDLVVARMRVDGELRNLTGPNTADLLRETRDVLVSATAFWGASVTVRYPDGTRETRAAVGAFPGVFETLGLPLQAGRPWGAEAMGTGAITDVVITDRYWRDRFGADPAVVGGTLDLSGGPVRVTGVTAPGFEFPTLETADFFFPPVTDPSALQRAGLGAFTVLGRLRPGASLEAAAAEIQGAWSGIRARHPGDVLDHELAVMGLQEYVTRDVREPLLALLGATFVLLILACANVGNLMLARSVDRGTEMAVRRSLGAGRAHIVRQLLAESALVAAAVSMVATGLAWGLLAGVRALAPAELPGVAEADLSAPALAFALALGVACTTVVGLVPVLRRPGPSFTADLRSGNRSTGGRAARRLQRGLVVAQIGGAAVLAVAAGLLLRSFATLSDVDPGYRTEGVVTALVFAPGDLYGTREARARFFREVERGVAEVPGVRSVGSTLRPPFSTGELAVPVRLADAESMTLADAPRVEVDVASTGYFGTLGIPVLQGRGFSDEDDADAPRVAILSERLARSLFGAEDPIGRRLTPVLGPWESATDWAEVVGVVGDIRLAGLDADAVGTLYLPMPQLPQGAGTVVAHVRGDARELTTAVRDAILGVEPQMVAPTVETMRSRRSESLAEPRFHSLLLGLFSALALGLSAVGIYGMLSYAVANRRLELGIRRTFGAHHGSVLWLVLREGLVLALAGLVLGAAGAVAVGRALAGLLYGITPYDPAIYLGTVALVGTMAGLGCLVPALRATRVEAVQALTEAR